jgi:serine/alanine adding enzyme
LKVIACKSEAERVRWEAFVAAHPEATKFHQWNWRDVIENAFGWQPFSLVAIDGATVKGILPLAWKKSRFFGSFVASLPSVSGGGVLATDRETELALIEEAKRITREVKADYLELRHREDRGLNLPSTEGRATVLIPIVADTEKLWNGLNSRVRTSIRKSVKSGLVVEFGGGELMDEFYAVFAENMRDLGTPVYSRRFFEEILRAFPSDIEICLVRINGKAVASAFLNSYRGVVEPQWAASLREVLALKPNMLMHWSILKRAAERGFKEMDFGRSWVGTGSYDYKMQWGGRAVPLHWDTWHPNSNGANHSNGNSVNRTNPKFQMLIRAWQKLPLPVTTFVGPRIARYLPS